MKKLVCYLLMAWLALISGGANAHSPRNALPVDAHHHTHTHVHQNDHELSAVQHFSLASVSVADIATDHTNTCNHTHCGHNHAAGMAATHSAYTTADATTAVPTSGASWASSAVADNIERPKWQFTTPAVVSLLT